MDEVFRWIETSDLSFWIRSSPTVFAFPAILVLHTMGMALFVGTGFALG